MAQIWQAAALWVINEGFMYIGLEFVFQEFPAPGSSSVMPSVVTCKSVTRKRACSPEKNQPVAVAWLAVLPLHKSDYSPELISRSHS